MRVLKNAIRHGVQKNITTHVPVTGVYRSLLMTDPN